MTKDRDELHQALPSNEDIMADPPAATLARVACAHAPPAREIARIRGLRKLARPVHQRSVMTAITRSTDLARSFEARTRRIFAAHHADLAPFGPAPSADAEVLRVRLVDRDGLASVIGLVDLRDGTAQLCTLGHALSLGKARLGREPQLAPRAYARFLELAVGVLSDHGLRVAIVPLGQLDERRAGGPPATSSGVRGVTRPYGALEAPAPSPELVSCR